MIRARLALVCISALACLTVGAAAAQACTKTWTGGGGSWSEEDRWTPKGVPTGEDEVCITAPGTYTVALAPYELQFGPSAGDNIKSLTLGGSGGGVQTLDILGQSSRSESNEQVNEVSLNVSATATVNSTGALILDATTLGVPGSEPAKEQGGSATFRGTLLNYGQILTRSNTTLFPVNKFEADFTNESGASIQVSSGALQEDRQGEGGYPWAATNDGTYTVDAGASVEMSPSFAGHADFTNDGSLINDGSITMSGASTTWTQSGGSIAGNAVVLQNGATLADSAGAAQFLLNHGSEGLTGTIPAGQTVTVLGSPNNYGGENYYENTLSLDGANLVNDGTLVFNASGSGEAGGGSVIVQDGSIQNNGSLVSQVEANASRRLALEAGLTNEPSGTLELQSGELDQGSGSATVNNGLVVVAPGAQYFLTEGSTFLNAGTISPEIASASSLGTFQISSACCNGPATLTAGGALAPKLVGGFLPANGEDFDLFQLTGGHFVGTFGSVGNAFSGDYSHESYATPSPNFVGAIYGAVNTGPPTGAGTTTPVPSPLARVVALAAGPAKLVVTLACAGGGPGCAPTSIKATVTEYFKGSKLTAIAAGAGKGKPHLRKKVVVIASAGVVVLAGGKVTLSLSLNAAGRALLVRYGHLSTLVTVSSGATTLLKRSVEIRKPARAVKKKKK